MLSLIMFQISIQNSCFLLKTSWKHTPNAAIAETEFGVYTNWVVTQLLIDHVYLNHLATRITDKWVLTNLQHLKQYGFLGYFFVQSQSTMPVLTLHHSAYKWQIKLGDLDRSILNSLGLH